MTTAPPPASEPAPEPAGPGARAPRTRTTSRPSPTARRVGYLVAIAVDVVLLVVIHASPGWEAASFLTDDAADVVGLVTFSIAVGVVANLVWLVTDPVWLRALGDAVTAAISVVVSARLLAVFPFTFDDGSPWPTLIRVALWVGVVGGSVGVVANLVGLGKALARRHDA
jgi:hypothetical protein